MKNHFIWQTVANQYAAHCWTCYSFRRTCGQVGTSLEPFAKNMGNIFRSRRKSVPNINGGKRFVILAIQLSISMGLLFYILDITPISQILKTLTHATPYPVFLTIALVSIERYVTAYQSKMFTDNQQMGLSSWQTFRIAYVHPARYVTWFGRVVPETDKLEEVERNLREMIATDKWWEKGKAGRPYTLAYHSVAHSVEIHLVVYSQQLQGAAGHG